MSQIGLASLFMTLQDTEKIDGVPKAKERKNGQDHEIMASDFKHKTMLSQMLVMLTLMIILHGPDI